MNHKKIEMLKKNYTKNVIKMIDIINENQKQSENLKIQM